MTKMTEREFLNAVLAIEGLSTDLADYAKEGISKLDARNDKRKNTPTKVQKENEGLMNAILTQLSKAPAVASEIAVALEISTQKASALCKLLVDKGLVSVKDYKVKNKGAVKQYSLVPTEVAE